MTDPDLDRILLDLDHLAGDHVFDLTAGLGDSAISATVAGITAGFDLEVDADGVPWPELESRYRQAKERLWPGRPILVKTGLLRSGLPGERTIAPDTAIYTFGTNDVDRAEAGYAEEGDPLANRPPRKFVDLYPDARAEVDGLFDDAFEQRTPS